MKYIIRSGSHVLTCMQLNIYMEVKHVIQKPKTLNLLKKSNKKIFLDIERERGYLGEAFIS